MASCWRLIWRLYTHAAVSPWRKCHAMRNSLWMKSSRDRRWYIVMRTSLIVRRRGDFRSLHANTWSGTRPWQYCVLLPVSMTENAADLWYGPINGGIDRLPELQIYDYTYFKYFITISKHDIRGGGVEAIFHLTSLIMLYSSWKGGNAEHHHLCPWQMGHDAHSYDR